MGKKEDQVRALRDQATAAVSDGKYAAALASYTQLAKLEPDDPGWLQRVADCHRRLGQKELELGALVKAAQGYRQQGFGLKAVALCKMALTIDPASATVKKQMADLVARISLSPAAKRQNAVQGKGKAVASRSKRPGLSKVEAKAQAASEPSLPLSSVSLIPKLPNAKQESALGIYELVLGKNKTIQLGQIAIKEKKPARTAVERALARTPLFGDVDASTLTTLVERIEIVHLEPAQVLFHEGDVSDALYVVADGEMVALRKGIELGHFSEGDFFGEVGLISDQPRQAMLGAASSTVLLKLDRALINELVDTRPGFLEVLLRFLRARLVRTLMLTSPLFKKLDARQQASLSKQFKFLEIDPGTVLVEQGAHAEGLFILLAGKATVRRERGERVQEIGHLMAGDVFGEMSLLSKKPAVGSVTVETRSFALFLPAKQFNELVMTNPMLLEAVSLIADRRQALLDAIGLPEGRADLIWVKPVHPTIRRRRGPAV